jgi:hypothetical protein
MFKKTGRCNGSNLKVAHLNKEVLAGKRLFHKLTANFPDLVTLTAALAAKNNPGTRPGL